jgi:hypothetical protein
MIPKEFEEDEKEAGVNFDLTKSFGFLMVIAVSRSPVAMIPFQA